MSAELRIGDAEREAAVTALGEHFVAGRLDSEEYDERTSAAWSARTSDDLAPLFADLPASSVTSMKAPTNDATPQPRRHHRPLMPWALGLAILPLAAVLLLVSLAVTDRIPWFVAVVAIWLLWSKLTWWGPHRHGRLRPGRTPHGAMFACRPNTQSRNSEVRWS